MLSFPRTIFIYDFAWTGSGRFPNTFCPQATSCPRGAQRASSASSKDTVTTYSPSSCGVTGSFIVFISPGSTDTRPVYSSQSSPSRSRVTRQI